MDTKRKIRIIIYLAFIILLLIFAYFIFWHKEQEAKSLAIETQKIFDQTNPFKINIEYPSISGYDNFNSLAKSIVDKEISDFKTNSLENDRGVKENDPETYSKYPREYDLIISYQTGKTDSQTASIVFNVSKFEGGAHGAEYQIPLNYDLKNGKEIFLPDIFAGQSDYLQKISDYCIADLTKQITQALGSENTEYIDYNWIKTGAGPDAENFKIFLIDNGSITFYFPQYQVAPYALGGFKVIMPK